MKANLRRASASALLSALLCSSSPAAAQTLSVPVPALSAGALPVLPPFPLRPLASPMLPAPMPLLPAQGPALRLPVRVKERVDAARVRVEPLVPAQGHAADPWRDLSPEYDGEGTFRALIEIPKGSKEKYELDKKTGLLRLDRVLDYFEGYPADYGFIPRTYADDGDPLDVLVLGEGALAPLASPRVRAIGVVRMVDGGRGDDKIVAVREDDPAFGAYRDLRELPAGVVEHLQRFFREYKASSGREVEVGEAQGAEAARAVVERALEDYRALGG